MKFRKIRRWYHKYLSRLHNSIYLGNGSTFDKEDGAVVKNSNLKINGSSSLRVSSGAFIDNVRFQIDGNSMVDIQSGVQLKDSDICVWNNSFVLLGTGSMVANTRFVIERGRAMIGDDNRLMDGMQITINNGTVDIKDHNVLSNIIWVRFGGNLSIGSYNCINEGAELRSDEMVSIGSYNMISYCCDIWDTNTHCRKNLDEKMERFSKDFPSIGKEVEKPVTSSVAIGDGVWLGKYSCVLKGTVLNNNVTVGTRTIVSNVEIESGRTVVSSESRII